MFSKSVQRLSSSVRMTKRFSSGSEGATASTGSFGQKEKAIENQWARAHDAEKLQLLRDAIGKQEKDTASLKKNLAELEKKHASTK
ncbi:uncharacterized protein EV154DRAFT_499730 [Mucor mucedo]|uniref:uncharacterized protein n=1 Tax=Mucor mucedo TaxID=29922 RepID=UPI0022203BF9|nr:uncharacterized protein EV154DRAFT_499730 [Mucor mucedo]KAI7893957.1 hypothetical protein EV154DRAFT_499730 [Mucor mucedo]